MYKLNNRGWGLGIFIAFIGIFLLAILMIVYVSKQYDTGMIDNTNKVPSANEKVKYSNYEKTIKESTILYSEEKHPNIQNGEIFYIDIELLDISDTIKNSCDGYAKVTRKNNVNYYYPYIKCESYMTTGYSSLIHE